MDKREKASSKLAEARQLVGRAAAKEPAPKQAHLPQSDKRIKYSEVNPDLQRLAKRDEAIAKLKKKLDGDGRVGLAFRRLVEAGCDWDWLESVVLHDWHSFPWKRATNPLSQEVLRELESTAKALKREARKLSPHLPLLVGRILREDGRAAEVIHLGPHCLKNLAEALTLAVTLSEGRRASTFVASHRVPYVLSEIRRMTKRPHFEEVAELYSASYRISIGADNLKSLEARAKRNASKRNESPSIISG